MDNDQTAPAPAEPAQADAEREARWNKQYYRNPKTGTLRSRKRDVRRAHGPMSGRQWVRFRKRNRIVTAEVADVIGRVVGQHREALAYLARH
jgi:hypothetical protein